ncbi:MAG: hypothetical protein ABII82_00395 [Verrucomicrobiota bacterium]
MKTNTTWLVWARRGAALAGAMDFGTGAALVAVPVLALRLMGLEVPGAEALVFLRWVGAFVGAVGASYLVAAWHGSEERLRAVFTLTMIFRLAAGGYSAVAILSGWLGWGWGWVSVPVTDLTLVAVQWWVLRKGEWSR